MRGERDKARCAVRAPASPSGQVYAHPRRAAGCAEYGRKARFRANFRGILEVGAYAHHSAALVAHERGGMAVSHDISPDSLDVGEQRARELGLRGERHQIAGDFHDLPFSDNFFDVVFIASAVHHTWKPWRVLSELVRVCKPGGIVRLENEPVGRDFCLYSFRSQRPESFGVFERSLEERGLMWTVSSPFPGSRAEELFGMVENDRIPLSVYLDALPGAKFTFEPVMGDFERSLLGCSWEQVGERLIEQLSGCELSPADKLRGLSMPTPDEVWKAVYRCDFSAKTDRALASLFGAALTATWRKPNRGKPGGTLLRRSAPGGRDLVSFPDVTPGELTPEYAACFPGWVGGIEHGKMVMVNTAATNEVRPPGKGLLLLRFYSAHVDDHILTITSGGEQVYRHAVVQAESHLARIMTDGTPLTIGLERPDGAPYSTYGVARATAKLLQVEPA